VETIALFTFHNFYKLYFFFLFFVRDEIYGVFLIITCEEVCFTAYGIGLPWDKPLAE